MDNFRTIYKILKYLEKDMDFDQADMDDISANRLNIGVKRWTAIIDMLRRDNYIDGFYMIEFPNGSMHVGKGKPKIRTKGIELLESLEKKFSEEDGYDQLLKEIPEHEEGHEADNKGETEEPLVLVFPDYDVMNVIEY